MLLINKGVRRLPVYLEIEIKEIISNEDINDWKWI